MWLEIFGVSLQQVPTDFLIKESPQKTTKNIQDISREDILIVKKEF